MGFWQGVAQGVREDKELDARRKEAEEQRAFDKEMLKEKLKLDVQSTILKTRLSRAASGESAKAMAGVLRGLQKVGVDDSLIQQISSTGDIAAAKELAATVEGQYKKALENGRGEEYIALVNDNLSRAKYSPATRQKIFSDAKERLLGDLSPEELGLTDLEEIIPGTMLVDTPVLIDRPSVTEVGQVEEMVIEYSLGEANKDQAALKRAMSSIDTTLENQYKILDSGSSTAESKQKARGYISSLENLKTTVLDRYNIVDSAIEGHKEYKDPSGLLGIYGSSSVQNIIDNVDSRFTLDKLNPAIREDIGTQTVPITVSDEGQAQWLRQSGLYNGPIAYRDTNGQTVLLRN
jgi:hypothetical protein